MSMSGHLRGPPTGKRQFRLAQAPYKALKCHPTTPIWWLICKAVMALFFICVVYVMYYAFLLSCRPSAWHNDFYCCFEANLLCPPLKFFIDPLLIINSLLTFVLISSVWEYRECCASQEHTDKSSPSRCCFGFCVWMGMLTPSREQMHILTPTHIL